MKKLTLLFLLAVSIQINVNAQLHVDPIKVVHAHYTTYYNSQKREPDSVAWDLTASMFSCEATRHNAFAQDPNIPGSASPSDYVHSGYSLGHLFNWDEAKCDGGSVNECFYLSNMLPQNQHFNAGDWGTVEKYERSLVATQNITIHIIAGGIGNIGTTPGGEVIPEYMWKAIYVNGKWLCWIMKNASSSVGHHANESVYTSGLGAFNNLTGLHLR